MWDEIVRKCLEWAETMLDKETAPTADTAEAILGLVETAIMVSNLNDGSPIGPGPVFVYKNGKVKIEKR